MSHKGFVMIPRDLLDAPIWNDHSDLTLWVYCALRATHARYGHLEPGQFCTSKSIIARDLHCSRNTVNQHLAHLMAGGFLRVQASSVGTLITVCHWPCLSAGKALYESEQGD